MSREKKKKRLWDSIESAVKCGGFFKMVEYEYIIRKKIYVCICVST